MEELHDLMDPIWRALTTPIIGSNVTLFKLLVVAFSLALLIWLAGRVTRWMVHRVSVRPGVDPGVVLAVGTLIRYAVLVVGFVIILQTAGIDLTTFTVLLGALGVGIGFGLQTIVGNFVSGLVLLFERPVKLGDRVVVGDVTGSVQQIGARATVVVTNDNIAIVVPNSHFITDRVINWSLTGALVRVSIDVGVSYSADPEQVRRVLLAVAAGSEDVEKEPAPEVRFREFGDSALLFSLLVWTRKHIATPTALRSTLNFAIAAAFKEAEVEIPFPQRDLHIRSGVLDVRQVGGSATGELAPRVGGA